MDQVVEEHEAHVDQVVDTPVAGPVQDHLIAQHMAGFNDDQEEEIPLGELPAVIEALLLAAPGPVSLSELSSVTDWPKDVVKETLSALDQQAGRGWVVQWHGQSVQLATNPRYAEQVRRLLGYEREARLSAAALETLAIVAYQQPVSRSGIESVRGVDSTGVLTTLLNRNLVESNQRADLPGQPFEYRTTPAFLQHFGIRSLDELPILNGSDGADLGDMLATAIEESVATKPSFELAGTMIQPVSGTGELANP